jgi:hypoxanthine phosphoribosyltransferase
MLGDPLFARPSMSIGPEEASVALAAAERLYDRAQIEAALDEMAAQIERGLQGRNPLVLCVMNGGLIVTGHLLTRLDFPLQLDYIHVTRYRGRTRGGEIHWHKEPIIPLRGRAVLIVDDILDEGHTLAEILGYCLTQGAVHTMVAVLVDKRHGRKVAAADVAGLAVDDRYVFGFGMDYKGYWRNLPAIYAAADA